MTTLPAPAHTKLMYRSEVTLQDAVVAVTLMECSMQSSALLGGINVLHSAFPTNADDEYAAQGKHLVNHLIFERSSWRALSQYVFLMQRNLFWRSYIWRNSFPAVSYTHLTLPTIYSV